MRVRQREHDVGGGGATARSADGSSWTLTDSGSHEELFAVAAGADRLVAVGGVEDTLTSTDGSRWARLR